MIRAMRNTTTIMTEATRRTRLSRSVGAGMVEPSHLERTGRRAGWNTDQEVPRLVVGHVSPGADRIPVQGRCPPRSMAFRRRTSAGRAPADHQEVTPVGLEAAKGVCDGTDPTCSISTRPQDGHRSDSHGMTEWQKGQGRYPVGMSPPVPFVRCWYSCPCACDGPSSMTTSCRGKQYTAVAPDMKGAPRPCRRGALELCDFFSRGAVCQVLLMPSTNTSTGCSSCCRQWRRRSGHSP
jgi:hypothetical protein